jgi:uncharacterized phage protein (TIGR01671 family)
MRNIKFRGKRTEDKKWIYGNYYCHQPPLQCIIPKNYIPIESSHFILKTGFADWGMPRPYDMERIDIDTLGQFTGLYDRNETEIYEGDIIRLRLYHYTGVQGDAYDWELGIIKWCDEKAGFYWCDGEDDEWKVSDTENEIVGNKWDNPEILCYFK